MGVFSIKRSNPLLLLFVIILTLLLLSACKGERNNTVPADTQSSDAIAGTAQTQESETIDEAGAVSGGPESGTGTEEEKTTTKPNIAEENGELLQSASVDLDGDGQNEQVVVIQVLKDTHNTDFAREIEGRLVISDADTKRVIPFCEKQVGFTEVITSIEFDDLDGDGADDIFIIVPENGASFGYFTYFIYSYKKDASYTFTSDNELADFIDGFENSYINGENRLTISNKKYNFSADILINMLSEDEPEETMLDYVHRTWIEPVSVNIGEDSRLALVKNMNGRPAIKVPLPIFGLATVDMIGELDLYFSVNGDFKPVLDRFEMLDFEGDKKVKIGSCDVR